MSYTAKVAKHRLPARRIYTQVIHTASNYLQKPKESLTGLISDELMPTFEKIWFLWQKNFVYHPAIRW